MSPAGLRSDKGCAGYVRQKLKTTDPTSHQRGHPTSTNPLMSKNTLRVNGKNWSRVPDGCLTPGRTNQLTAGRNITLTLNMQNCDSYISIPWPQTYRSYWLQHVLGLLTLRNSVLLYITKMWGSHKALGNIQHGISSSSSCLQLRWKPRPALPAT
jgi:hypothetical protein